MFEKTLPQNRKSERIYCLIRRQWIFASPEEKIRQSLIRCMVDDLGFPLQLLAIEKSLKQLPHLIHTPHLPKRRLDLLCFAPSNERKTLYPMLLVECKAIKLSPKAIYQVIGYNHYVGAQYILLANQFEKYFGWMNPSSGDYNFISYLPHYKKLVGQNQELSY